MKVLILILASLCLVAIADDDKTYDAVVALAKAGNYAAAETVLEATPINSVRMAYALGYVKEKRNKKDDAIKAYLLAMRLNLVSGNGTENAERALKRLGELSPAHVDILNAITGLQLRQAKAGNRDKAMLQGAVRVLMDYACGPALEVVLAPAAVVTAKTPSRRPSRMAVVKALGYIPKAPPRDVDARRAPLDAKADGFARHSYAVFKERLSWPDAQKRCKKMGGYLACITSAEENEFVHGLRPAGETSHMWIGGKLTAPRKWEWITGNPLVYENWLQGGWPQPDYEPAGADVICIRNDGAWSDDVAGSIRSFICEWER